MEKELLDKINKYSKQQGANDKAKQSFIDSLNVFFLNFKRIQESHKLRQYLIDEQCNTQIFGGELHEKYHLASSQLKSDLDNYFSSIKTSLNRLPRFLRGLLKHKEGRKIKIKSFGSFINSLEPILFKSSNLESLRVHLTKEGKKIDDSINEYRDKEIEHVSDPNYSDLSSTPTGLKKIHYNIDNLLSKLPFNALGSQKTIGGKGYYVKMRPDGIDGYVYYVHISPQNKNMVIKKGESVGEVTDDKSGHFYTYGPHMHLFSSSNIPLDRFNPVNISKYSPEINEAQDVMIKYLIKTFDLISKI